MPHITFSYYQQVLFYFIINRLENYKTGRNPNAASKKLIMIPPIKYYTELGCQKEGFGLRLKPTKVKHKWHFKEQLNSRVEPKFLANTNNSNGINSEPKITGNAGNKFSTMFLIWILWYQE